MFKYFLGRHKKTGKPLIWQHIREKYQDKSTVNNNEIEFFQDYFKVGPVEAVGHIHGIDKFWRSWDCTHRLEILPIHVQDEEPVHLHAEAEGEVGVEQLEVGVIRAQHLGSKLLQFFEVCREPRNRNLLYKDVVKHYCWKNNHWDPVSRSNALGSIKPIKSTNPNRELYALYLLLAHVPGPTSHDNLKFVPYASPEPFDTFQAAAEAQGLIVTARCARLALEELVESQPHLCPRSMREFFSLIIQHNRPDDMLELWDDFKKYMIGDFVNQDMEPDDAMKAALKHIWSILVPSGITRNTCNLPFVAFREETEVFHLDPLMHEQLNEDQREAFEAIIAAIEDPDAEQRLFFVNGPAGTGKSFLFNSVCAYLNGKGDSFVCSAASAVAATHLPGGRTNHSTYGIQIDKDEHGDRTYLAVDSPAAIRLLNASVHFIYEASMMKSWQLDVVDDALQKIVGNNQPFGNKVLVLGADIRQILLILDDDDDAMAREVIFGHNLFSRFRIFNLSVNNRALEDATFAKWLLSVGDGSANDSDEGREDFIRLPQYLRDSVTGDVSAFNWEDNLQGLIKNVFQGDFSKHDHAILTTRNFDCNHVNNLILGDLPGETHTRFGSSFFELRREEDGESDTEGSDVIDADEYDDPDDPQSSSQECSVEEPDLEEPDDDELFEVGIDPNRRAAQLSPSGLPPHVLKIKEGSVCMIVRNISLCLGLVNGTKIRVKKAGVHVITAEVLTGKMAGQFVHLPRLRLTDEKEAKPKILVRVQFPFKLSYCSTIDKSQGQTLSTVGLYLRKPVFSHGPLYVALSRARRARALHIHIAEGPQQGKIFRGGGLNAAQYQTRNVVNRRIMQLFEAAATVVPDSSLLDDIITEARNINTTLSEEDPE